MSTLVEKLETLKALDPNTVLEAYKQMREEEKNNPGTYNQKELEQLEKILETYIYRIKGHYGENAQRYWVSTVDEQIKNITEKEKVNLTVKTLKTTFKQPEKQHSTNPRTQYYDGPGLN